jgi:sigma-B regulation protein RsbU (phosphoserine phosphatase)
MTSNHAWTHAHTFNNSPCSGDLIEVSRIGKDRIAIAVGDVIGRGETAGRVARELRACIRTSLLTGDSPATTLVRSDDLLAGLSRGTDPIFASLFVAICDSRTGRVTYGSAGHDIAMLFSWDLAQHRHLLATGPLIGLGLEPGIGGFFEERSVCLGQGSLLAVVTDGIGEARSPAHRGRHFGSSGVAAAIRGARMKRTDPARAVHLAATAFAEQQLDDDASVLVLAVGSHRYAQRHKGGIQFIEA